MSWDLATAKKLLGIDSADTTQDALITNLMDTTLSSIETVLQRDLLQAETTKTYHKLWTERILLSRYPVVEVTEVDGEEMPDLWELQADRGFIILPHYKFFDLLSILYTGGYDSAALPLDLERAMWEAFLYLYEKTTSTGAPQDGGIGTDPGSGSGEVSRVTVQDFGSVTFDTARSLSGDSALAMTKTYLDWGWLYPWAPTLQFYRSEQGTGLGLA